MAYEDLLGSCEENLVRKTEEDGSPVPGVTVTATSPAMQGQRTAYTGESGNWVIRNLPPGQYELTFELEGMATPVQSTVKRSTSAGRCWLP